MSEKRKRKVPSKHFPNLSRLCYVLQQVTKQAEPAVTDDAAAAPSAATDSKLSGDGGQGVGGSESSVPPAGTTAVDASVSAGAGVGGQDQVPYETTREAIEERRKKLPSWLRNHFEKRKAELLKSACREPKHSFMWLLLGFRR